MALRPNRTTWFQFCVERHENPEVIVAAAERENILIWGDQGRVRASAHLFTTEEDVEIFLKRLPDFL